jgi:hypothetical protein
LLALVTPISVLLAKPEDELPPRLDATINKGLAFLAKQQDGTGALDKNGFKVSITSLGLLAFLAAGQAPDVGKYGLNVRNAVDFLLAHQAKDGYFGAGDRGMYAHAMATLALSQAYGLESSASVRAQIHARLKSAVAVIVAAQNVAKSAPSFEGGWRYERNSPDADLSVSAWNLMALRAAQDCGIPIPTVVRQRALAFVLRCYDETNKGFAYQPGGGSQPGDTAIAVLSLYVLEAVEANAARLDGALKYLQQHPIDDNSPYPYYCTAYLVQVAVQHGDDAWLRLGRPAIERLIRTQEKDGGWPQAKSGAEPGRACSTALALAALTVPYRLLPAYQR